MPAKNYAYVNKEMLIWARGETPFSVPEEAAVYLSGISAEQLIAWENGSDLPSINEAKKLAALYKVPLACFYLSEPPEKRVKKYTDRRTMNGTVYCETSYELWSEIGRITSNREKLLEFADTDEIGNYPLPTFTPDKTVDDIADELRGFLGVQLPFKTKSAYKNNAFNYFRRAFEHRGIAVSQISGVSLNEMRGLSICYDTCPIIAINNRDFERAKVFSLFHELAHLVRRSSSLCRIDFDERNDEEEKICDNIAAATLLPKKPFLEIAKKIFAKYDEWSSVSLQAVGDKFGVSSVVVLRRLYELGSIRKSMYIKIYKILNDEFEANRELIEQSRRGKNIPVHFYVKYLNQQGYLFPRAILNAHANGKLTYGEMCKTLNVNSKHIGNIERAVMFT